MKQTLKAKLNNEYIYHFFFQKVIVDRKNEKETLFRCFRAVCIPNFSNPSFLFLAGDETTDRYTQTHRLVGKYEKLTNACITWIFVSTLFSFTNNGVILLTNV